MKKILLISHFNYTNKGPVYGPIHNVFEYLKNSKVDIKFIGLPLYSGEKSFEIKFNRGNERVKKFGNSQKNNILSKSISEIYNTILQTTGENFDLVIAADPLNAFSACILKLLGRVKKVIFFTVDYSDDRFGNVLLNGVYYFLDKICLMFSDQVWNVSTRIFRKRLMQGVSREKLFLVPNSPTYNSALIKSVSKIDRYRIIMVTGQTHTPVLNDVLSAFGTIARSRKKVSLEIIGPGTNDRLLINTIHRLGLGSKIKLFLHMDHEDLLRRIAKCGIGLAIYTKDFSWTYFGDSMKAREYLACGVPVVITNVVSTSEDVRKHNLGVVTKPDVKSLSSSLGKLIDNKSDWLKKRENAINYSKKMSMDNILQRALPL